MPPLRILNFPTDPLDEEAAALAAGRRKTFGQLRALQSAVLAGSRADRDTGALDYLGDVPNAAQLAADGKLILRQRLELVEDDVIVPGLAYNEAAPLLESDEDDATSRGGGGAADSPGATPAQRHARANWQAGAHKALAASKVEGLEARAQHARRLKQLARTPHPMLMTRIAQLVAQLAEIRRHTLGADRVSLKSPPPRGSLVSPPTALSPPTRPATKAAPKRREAACFNDESRATFLKSRGGSARLRDSTVAAAGPGLATAGSLGDASAEELMCQEDACVRELSLFLRFLSETLATYPASMVDQLCRCCKLEQLEHQHIVYHSGDEATKWYIVLGGMCEALVIEPGETYRPLAPRRLTALYRKGACFGELELLDSSLRRDTVVTGTHTLLGVISKKDFLDILGSFRLRQQATCRAFLRLKTPALAGCSETDISLLSRHLDSRRHPAGTEFEPMQQEPAVVYFLKSGQVSYQALDRRGAPSLEEARRMMRDPKVPTLAASGILANVGISDGCATGTLGEGEKLKQLRRKLTPRVTLASSGPGTVFGGGRHLMGAGEHQSTVKVVAVTQLEVYCIPAEALLVVMPPPLVTALRAHVAFQLTYWFSRVGMIDSKAAIGHDSTDLVQLSLAAQQEAGRKRDRRKQGQPAIRAAPPSAVGGDASGAAGDAPPGRYGSKVAACLGHVQQLQKTHRSEVTTANIDLQGTPTEKFWAHPEHAFTDRRRQAHLFLKVAFPAQLQPLCDRLDRLELKVQQRRGASQQQTLAPSAAAVRESSTSSWPLRGEPYATELAAGCQEDVARDGGADGRVDSADTRRPHTAGAQSAHVSDDTNSKSGVSPASWPAYSPPRTAPAGRNRRRGEITAAGVLWEFEKGLVTPAVRQMLTYAEIRRHKQEKSRGGGERAHADGD